MEELLQLTKGSLKAPQKLRSSLNPPQKGKIAKHIVQSVVGRSQGRKSPITKKHMDRYLYTFALQIGCDIPNDEMLKNIYLLLVGSSEDNSISNADIEQEDFICLIEVCLGLYQEANKTAIGGIFQRIIMGLKQTLYYSRLHSIAIPKA